MGTALTQGAPSVGSMIGISVLERILSCLSEPYRSCVDDIRRQDGLRCHDRPSIRRRGRDSATDDSRSWRNDSKAAPSAWRDDSKAWIIGQQRRSGYNRRNLVEATMHRCNTIIRRRLHACALLNQWAEARIGCNLPNCTTELGIPLCADPLTRPPARGRRNRQPVRSITQGVAIPAVSG
jgi:hypothetical protein